nr:polysaccharide deacetylase family protein [Candidatus Njordarchaeum guaymaensis]
MSSKNVTPRLACIVCILILGFSCVFFTYGPVLLFGRSRDHSGPCVVLTFDDGYLSVYRVAYPLMRRFDFRGVVFVPTHLVGDVFEGERLLGFSELKLLQWSGWEIGSHTASHSNLTILTNERIGTELSLSKDWLSIRGFSPTSLSLPYSSFNQEVLDMAFKYYKVIRTTGERPSPLPTSQFYGSLAVDPSNIDVVLDQIANRNSSRDVLVLTFHGITEANQAAPSRLFGWIREEQFLKILEGIKLSGRKAVTFRDLIVPS